MKTNVQIAQPAQIAGAEVRMNRMQRRAVRKAAHKRAAKTIKITAEQAAANSPVGLSIFKARSNAEFRNLIFTTRIKIIEMEDGCDGTEMLASLAVVIGTVAQAGASELGREVPWVRQLHGALRTVDAMCRAGYKWQSMYSAAMEVAVGIAAQDRQELDPDSFMAAWDLAVGFAERIFEHNISDCEVSA